jgi:hypothetical protein
MKISSSFLNGKTKWFGGGALVLSAAVVIGGWVWGASANNSRLEQFAEEVEDHETRLRKVEDCVSRTDENIQWIRKRLERTP